MASIDASNLNGSAFPASIPTSGKGRNTNLTMIEKLEVIKRIDSNIPYSKISQEFNIAKGTVNKIKRSREAIVESVEKHGATGETIKRTRFSKDGKLLDSLLVNWISEAQERGELVTGKLVQEKALEIASENSISSFKASNGWLQCFQRRHAALFTSQDPNGMANGAAEPESSSRVHSSSRSSSGRRPAGPSLLVTRQVNAWRHFKELLTTDPLVLSLAPHIAAIDEHLGIAVDDGRSI